MSAGPREFPPLVTALVIDFEAKVSESELPSKSAALTLGIAQSKSAPTRKIIRTTFKPVLRYFGFTFTKSLGFAIYAGKLKSPEM
jgi:hypothetical protein